MTLRNPLDPYGGATPVVDNLIGDAYPVVRAVYLRLKDLVFLSENFDKLSPHELEFRSNQTEKQIEWRYVAKDNEAEFPWSLLVTYDDLLGADVQAVMDYLTLVNNEVTDKAAQVAADTIEVANNKAVVDTKTAQVLSAAAEVETAHGEVITAHDEVILARDETLVARDEAVAAANDVAPLRADLATAADSSKGAGMVGYTAPSYTGLGAVTVYLALNQLFNTKLSKIAQFGSSSVDVLYRNGTIYESSGTVTKEETRPWLHDFRPTVATGSAFNTDGGNLYIGHGAGNFTASALPDEDVPPGKDPQLQTSHNLGIGVQALGQLTIGYKNVGVGNNALRKLTEGHGNTAIGRDAGHEITTANECTFAGFTAGQLVVSGPYNTAYGAASLYANTAGQGNTAIGRRSLFAMTDGSYNTAIGENAGFGHLTGSYNTYVGKQAANAGVTSGSNCTIIGSRVATVPNISGAVVLADGAGTKYVDIQPTGGGASRVDLVSVNATAYDPSATDGQITQGSTVSVRNNANTQTSFSQVVFISRTGQPTGRVVCTGGTSPVVAVVVNNVEAARFNGDGSVQLRGATGPGIYNGTGSPEGVVVARPGSMYLNASGGAGTSLYMKESGTGNTGWVAK